MKKNLGSFGAPIAAVLFLFVAAIVFVRTGIARDIEQWFYKANYDAAGCPLVSGAQTFTQSGQFVPPPGISAQCPLFVRALIIGGGGSAGICGGTAGRIVAFQTSISAPVPVVVGGTGEDSQFAGLTAQAGIDDGLSKSKRIAGRPSTIDSVAPSSKQRNNRYAPSFINNLPFNAASVTEGVRSVGTPNKSCSNKNGSGMEGLLINKFGPAPLTSADGTGYGAGGGTIDGVQGRGLPGVVFLEW